MRVIRRGWWVLLIAVIVAAVLLLPFTRRLIFGDTTARAANQTAQVSQGDISAQVLSSASLQPAADLSLTFGSAGTVSNIAVKPGDKVEKGQTLAQLDTADLQLSVTQATANLSSAQAKLTLLKAPPNEGDVKVAKDNLASAQAKLALVKAGATQVQISAAQLKVTQAQSSLDKAKSSSSTSQQQADIAVHQATNAVQNAQDSYSKVAADALASNGSFITALPTALTPKYGDLQGLINEYNKQKRALEDAQGNLQKAQLSAADARLQATQNAASAQASLDDANKQLKDVTAGPSAADLAAAQTSVDQAQNTLDKLTAPPTAQDLAQAQASVDQAQANLDSAKLKLKNATLIAPFAGTIASVPVKLGQTVSANTAVAEIVDMSAFHVDMNIGESDVTRVKVGQPVDVTFDALAGQVYTGTVTFVAPNATIQQGVVSYLATVTLDPKAVGSDLMPGMSASTAAIVESHQNVLLMPNRAIRTESNQKVVYVIGPGGQQIRVPVKTGISDDTSTEIVGQTPLRPGDAVVITTPTSATTTRGGGGGGGGLFGAAAPRP